MSSKLAHRGPDNSGLWTNIDSGLVLSHTRLSILDLSSAGSQPMKSSTGRYVITFNCEMFYCCFIRVQIFCT